jgi:protein subunit release factor B
MKLAQMYRGFADRRGFEVNVLNDHLGGHPWEDSITLQLTGAGAYALLQGEAGLHHFSNKRNERNGRRSAERDVARRCRPIACASSARGLSAARRFQDIGARLVGRQQGAGG